MGAIGSEATTSHVTLKHKRLPGLDGECTRLGAYRQRTRFKAASPFLTLLRAEHGPAHAQSRSDGTSIGLLVRMSPLLFAAFPHDGLRKTRRVGAGAAFSPPSTPETLEALERRRLLVEKLGTLVRGVGFERAAIASCAASFVFRLSSAAVVTLLTAETTLTAAARRSGLVAPFFDRWAVDSGAANEAACGSGATGSGSTYLGVMGLPAASASANTLSAEACINCSILAR